MSCWTPRQRTTYRLGSLLGPFLLLFAIAEAVAEESIRNLLDAEVAAAWQRESLTPAPAASDSEFVRRIYLDLVGVIPAHAEAAAFIDDPAADKRTKLVDALLSDPRYARHQAEIWDLILFTRNPPGFETDRRDGIQKWLEKQFAENVPYDQWTRALLKAEGNSVEDGPPMYYVQYRSRPEDANEAISQTFLGVQLQCARCHDHPYEPWKQVDFYGMAAFLARLQIVSVGKQDNLSKFMVAEKSSGDILFTGAAKDQEVGKKGEPVKPKFLVGEPLAEPPLPVDFKEVKFEDNKLPPKPLASRKDQLAEWITSRENPYFTRAIVNRVWAQFLGRGIVHPIDHLSNSNPPSLPSLFDRLEAEFKSHNYDLKWLIRELVASQTYQLSSRGASEDPMPRWHQSARVRALSAEELRDSWRVATWHDAAEEQAKKPPSKDRFHPLVRDYMLRYFGTPNTGTGDFQGGLHEHLFLSNGPLLGMINGGKGSLADWLATSQDPFESRVERLYLSTLTRRPTTDEVERVRSYLGDSNPPRWGDVIWSLITSSEFRFNH